MSILLADEGGFGRARNTDPATSTEAAASVNVSEREMQVLDALFALTEGTNEGIADWLANYYARPEIPSNVSPRIKPLRDRGLVEYAGYTKKSRQGSMCKVWRLTEVGKKVAGVAQWRI